MRVSISVSSLLAAGVLLFSSGRLARADGKEKEVETLILGMQSKDANERAEAARKMSDLAFNGTRSEKAVRPLLALLKDKDETVRSAAELTMRNMGRVATPALCQLLQDKTADADSMRRAEGVLALTLPAFSPDERAELTKVAIPALTAAMKDKDPKVREAAAAPLVALGPQAKGAITLLADALRDKDVAVRVEVAKALSSLGREARAAVDRLIGALTDADDSVRFVVCEALGKLGKDGAKAVPALCAAMQNARASVYERQAAVTAVLNTAFEEGVDDQAREKALVAYLRLAEDKEAEAVAVPWAEVGEEALPGLTKALGRKSARTRLVAATAMKRVFTFTAGADRHGKALNRIDTSTDPGKSAVAALHSVLEDSDWKVRDAAQEALKATESDK